MTNHRIKYINTAKIVMLAKAVDTCILDGASVYATSERTKEIKAIISNQRFILLAVK